MNFLVSPVQARPEREKQSVRDDFLIAQFAHDGGQRIALFHADLGWQRLASGHPIKNVLEKRSRRNCRGNDRGKEKIASSIEREIKFGNGPIRPAAFLNVIVERAATFNMFAEHSAHE